MSARRRFRPVLLPVLFFILLALATSLVAAPTRRRRMLTCLMRWIDAPGTSSSHPVLFVARDGVPIPDAIEHGFRITGALMNNASNSPGGREYALTQEVYELITTALRTRLAAVPAELSFDDTTAAAAVAARVDTLRRELGGLRPLVDMVYGDSYVESGRPSCRRVLRVVWCVLCCGAVYSSPLIRARASDSDSDLW